MDVRTGSLNIEGGRLYYERVGEGFPIVLIHGGLWDLRVWDEQLVSYSEHHDVVRYDLRGSGRSDPPTRAFSNVRDLRGVLDELEIQRCAIVGCSIGAQIALDAALTYPEHVEAIVLVSPDISGYEWQDQGLDLLFAQVQRAVTEGDLETAMDVCLAVWAPLDPDSEISRTLRAIAMENTGIFQVPDELVEPAPPALPRLGEVQAATLIVVGDRDVAEIQTIADLLASDEPLALPGVFDAVDDGQQGKPLADVYVDDRSPGCLSLVKIGELYGEPFREVVVGGGA